jgi:hypothetical protein
LLTESRDCPVLSLLSATNKAFSSFGSIFAVSMTMKHFFTFLGLVTFYFAGFAQAELKIPLMRQLYHDNINKSQLAIERLDKKEDGHFYPLKDETLNQQISYALFNKVDDLQRQIELDDQLDNNGKIKFLRGLNEMLSLFESSFRYRSIKATLIPELVAAYQDAMQLEKNESSIESVIDRHEIETGKIILNCYPFTKSKGLEQCGYILIRKACERNPEKILTILKDNSHVPFADSLIVKEAYRRPEELYNYAAASATPLGKRINAIEDPLVKLIATLANQNTGRLFFPFLDDLYKGKKSIDELAAVADDTVKYFRLLVNTQIDYAGRMQKGDTPLVAKTLAGMLRKKAVDIFINEINGLHEAPTDKIRFRILDSLTIQELYYLPVMGETEIYTSSYLRGVYDGIFKKAKNIPKGDSLLMSVNFDHFKKWIKIAAGYNTLNDFLKRMDNASAESIMKSFVNNLDKTGSLEDAVDVADSYASISDSAVKKMILSQVQLNLSKAKADSNNRAATIYEVLNNIFLSLDTANKIDLAKLYGIRPVYTVPVNSLKDSSGRIIVQQFFYGDDDGKSGYANFMKNFRNGNWKIVEKPEWSEVIALKGTPVIIYSNRPLDEQQDLDAQAQKNLNVYLQDNNFLPTITIHRGHSYFVKYTIEQLFHTGKVVLLGSCGGFHSLNEVLEICPQAHIIATKQVGTRSVHQPMINVMMETLRQGKEINWPLLWKQVEKLISTTAKEKFDDYVPPYKNLGALFINAYNMAIERSEE